VAKFLGGLLLGVLISSYLDGRVLLVPEEYPHFQEAMVVARDGDTVSFKVPTPE